MEVPSENQARPRESSGFTLTELLVVLGVTMILGTIAFNALQSTARAKVESVQCMNNHKQLIAAALLYADEFNGLWLPNQPGQTDWVMLNMDWFNNTDDTNINKLINPAYCKLAPYIHGDPKVFHCPSDHSYIPSLGYRARSVSMSQAVGTVWTATGCLPVNGAVNGQWLTGNNIGTSCQTVWRCYGKSSDFIAPGPGKTWVFSDEHCDSMNDAGLAVQCSEQGIGAPFIDRPANYHNGAATMSFADGHVEIHKWSGPTLGKGPNNWEGPMAGGYAVTGTADNTDLIWLQQRTSAKD